MTPGVGEAWSRYGGEARGIATLRLALVPIALITQSGHSDLSYDVFPWLVVVFALYAAGSLAVTFVSPQAGRIAPVPAIVDLCAVSALVYVTGGEHSSLKFAFYVLPIGAALRLSPKLTASWAVLSVLAYLTVTLPHPATSLPSDADLLIDDSISLLWVSGAAVMLSAMVGRRQRALVEFADMRRTLIQMALDASAHEQRRLAEALHDHAVQNVLLARQELTDVVRGVPGAEARARAALDETDRQLRHEIFAMHPLGLEQAGLVAVLSSLADNAAQRGGFTVSVHVGDGAERAGHHDLVIAAARELLTNAVKHARAGHVDVRLICEGGMLCLTIADDGTGIDLGMLGGAVRTGHIGLATLRERLRARGGRLDASGSPGSGTTMRVVIPAPGGPALSPAPARRDPAAAVS